MTVRIIVGNALDVLTTLPTASIQCAVTSPPYFGMRSYLPDGHADKAMELGIQQTPDDYIASLVRVFRELRRVLAHDGVFWLNLGDAMRAKNLLMMPARVALALQADGWNLRSHCIWHKPNPMPDGAKDRPTSAHESMFLLTKNARYYYDAKAVAEPCSKNTNPYGPGGSMRKPQHHDGKVFQDRNDKGGTCGQNADGTRNLRNVWSIVPRPYKGAHFAVFPVELAARCIHAASKPGDTVIDPFFGAGTTALAAHDRHYIGIDINAEYAELARSRLTVAGLIVVMEQSIHSAELLEAAE